MKRIYSILISFFLIQFLNGVIYYLIRENSPELIDDKDNIPEIIEHKTLKA
mgnify:FL=1